MQTSLFESYRNMNSIILSASRMTDMPAFFQQELINEINCRLEKGKTIHTLVLWTKHISSLFRNPLYDFLIKLKKKGIQLYIQLTITGMGGTCIGETTEGKPFFPEPNVPNYKFTLERLPKLIKLIGSPDRILLRIDPIMRFHFPNGEMKSNLSFFEEITKEAARYNIKRIAFSFLEKNIYKKIDAYLCNLGIDIMPPNKVEREKFKFWLDRISKEYQVLFQACSVRGFEESKCVDSKLLEMYHDQKLLAPKQTPHSRKKCGCNKSIDIGGWPPKPCPSGCIYCYASPLNRGILNNSLKKDIYDNDNTIFCT